MMKRMLVSNRGRRKWIYYEGSSFRDLILYDMIYIYMCVVFSPRASREAPNIRHSLHEVVSLFEKLMITVTAEKMGET